MRVLPCGRTGLLVELDTLADVLALYAGLRDRPPEGVTELVPAARTLLLRLDPGRAEAAEVERALREVPLREEAMARGELVQVPVRYDGEDLEEVGRLTGLGASGVVERHTGHEWAVAFCGFAPGFGYLVCPDQAWDVPRRDSPRTRVPPGAVALAGEFSGVYPRQSPGGWQLIGHTETVTFDVERDPPALLTPGTRVRFVDVGGSEAG